MTVASVLSWLHTHRGWGDSRPIRYHLNAQPPRLYVRGELGWLTYDLIVNPLTGDTQLWLVK